MRTNKINGKKYVGQASTKNFRIRQNNWKCLTQKYAGTAINNARAKYGIDAFDFEILKECDDKELDYWEKYYIKELNTKIPYGYNMTDGGETIWNKGKPHSEETRRKMSEARIGVSNFKLAKQVLQMNKHTNEVIAEFPSTMEVKRQLGFSFANISACCLGKPHHNSAYGFKWKYKEESVA